MDVATVIEEVEHSPNHLAGGGGAEIRGCVWGGVGGNNEVEGCGKAG